MAKKKSGDCEEGVKRNHHGQRSIELMAYMAISIPRQ